MLILCWFLSGFLCCNKPVFLTDEAIYDSIPTVKPVQPVIQEASGIADSKLNKGMLWVEEDSGNPPRLLLLSHEGVVTKSIYIKGAENRDWEDMVLAGSDIYIGDIGDNLRIHTSYTIYKFPEPLANVDTITQFETIRFFYPDTSHDAEAFLVDPVSKDIFIITKRDVPSRVYKIPYPYSFSAVNSSKLVGTISYTGVVSAALSPDSKKVILKTYMGMKAYSRVGKEALDKTLQRTPVTVPYFMEPQGEAVAFAADNSGYFTLSEKGLSQVVNLYFYSLKK